MVQCPWCLGTFVVAGVFLVDHYLWTIPAILLYLGAAMALVGYLGSYDERP